MKLNTLFAAPLSLTWRGSQVRSLHRPPAPVIPGRAQREPGIHNHRIRKGCTVVPHLHALGLWIPGSSLREAPE
jgi:hypothetical protein